MPAIRTTLAIALGLACAPLATFAATGPVTPTFERVWGMQGSLANRFNVPIAVATDVLGDVYVVDQFNHRVQKFDRFGLFLAKWGSFGSGNGQFDLPSGVAAHASGVIYVSDNSNHRIQKFSTSGAYLGQWGSYGTGNGQFSSPSGVAVDAAGNVYVSDQFNHRVQKFTADGTFVTKWGSLGSADGQFGYPSAIAVDGTGNVYVTDLSNDRVQKFTSSGTFLGKWGSFGFAPGLLQDPYGVATDAVGNVYVSDYGNHRIQKFGATGSLLATWGGIGSGNGQFNYQAGIAVDAAANVYVADQLNHRIQKFSGAGIAAENLPPAHRRFIDNVSPFQSVYDLAMGPMGLLYVLSWTGSIRRYTSAGDTLASWTVTQGSFSNDLYGMAFGTSGRLYVVDRGSDRVAVLDANGQNVNAWGSNGSADGQFKNPLGIAADAGGNIYVADTENNRIQKFSSEGAFLLKWGSQGSSFGQFSRPRRIAIDGRGVVYVTDGFNSRVQMFDTGGNYLGQFGAPGTGDGQFDSPFAIAVGPSGAIYVSDQFTHNVQKFTPDGGFLCSWGGWGSEAGQLNGVVGITIDASENVHVAEVINNRIQAFVTRPSVALVSDVRNDEGRLAQLRVLRASVDAPGAVPSALITGYEVYRKNEALPAPSGTPGRAEDRAQLAGWTYVTSFPAHGESEYGVVVPTLVDATASALEFSTYLVRAVTSDPFTFFDSGAEQGFSVDNLPPATPVPFAATYQGGTTHLHWTPSTAVDFAAFRLYRGASADFVPGPANFLLETTDTASVDAFVAGTSYKLSAVDRNGNESAHALASLGQTVDVPPPAASAFAFALDGARPNPSLGTSLRVHFVLPSASQASLELFDIAGRCVVRRNFTPASAGPQSIDLAPERRLAAGVYVVRLAHGAEQRSARAVVID